MMNGTPTRRVRRTAERALFLGCIMFGLPAKAQPTEPPKLLSRPALLIEEKTGDAYVRFSPSEPAKFLLTGPGRMQAELRANLAADATPSAAEAMVVSVFLGGKVAARFRVQPTRPSADSSAWKGETAIRPSQPVGFFIDVEPGPQLFEIKINGGPRGGASLLLGSTATAKRPLAATAPVIASRPAPSPVAHTAPSASAPTPDPTPIPITPDTLRSGPAEDAPRNHAAFVGAGWISQSEWAAFEDRRAADLFFDYQRIFPERGLAFTSTGEARFGRERVRLLNDAPGDDPRDVRESRYVLGLAATWRRALLRPGATVLEADVGVGYRLEAHDAILAPFMVGFGGPILAVSVQRGPVRGTARLDVGFPLHDSSPRSLSAGPIEGRLGWITEFRWIVERDVDLVIGYRGEAMDRTYSRRSSEGFVTGISVGF